MKAPTLILMDVDQHAGLPFPRSLPEFQRLFPGDAACAEYLEKVRWGDGFVCPHCGVTGEPFRISTRPGVLACRNCRRQTGLTVGTVMERSHTSLSTWFWAAYLVANHHTPGMSAVQFQRQLGIARLGCPFNRSRSRRDSGAVEWRPWRMPPQNRFTPSCWITSSRGRRSSPMHGRVTGGWRRMGTSMTAVASGPHQREARTL